MPAHSTTTRIRLSKQPRARTTVLPQRPSDTLEIEGEATYEQAGLNIQPEVESASCGYEASTVSSSRRSESLPAHTDQTSFPTEVD